MKRLLGALLFLCTATLGARAQQPGLSPELQRALEAYRAEDYHEARRLLEPLSAQGDPVASTLLGNLLARGLHGPQNETEAMASARKMQAQRLLLQARSQHYDDASRVLGDLSLEGILADPDPIAALRYYLDAPLHAYFENRVVRCFDWVAEREDGSVYLQLHELLAAGGWSTEVDRYRSRAAFLRNDWSLIEERPGSNSGVGHWRDLGLGTRLGRPASRATLKQAVESLDHQETPWPRLEAGILALQGSPQAIQAQGVHESYRVDKSRLTPVGTFARAHWHLRLSQLELSQRLMREASRNGEQRADLALIQGLPPSTQRLVVVELMRAGMLEAGISALIQAREDPSWQVTMALGSIEGMFEDRPRAERVLETGCEAGNLDAQLAMVELLIASGRTGPPVTTARLDRAFEYLMMGLFESDPRACWLAGRWLTRQTQAREYLETEVPEDREMVLKSSLAILEPRVIGAIGGEVDVRDFVALWQLYRSAGRLYDAHDLWQRRHELISFDPDSAATLDAFTAQCLTEARRDFESQVEADLPEAFALHAVEQNWRFLKPDDPRCVRLFELVRGRFHELAILLHMTLREAQYVGLDLSPLGLGQASDEEVLAERIALLRRAALEGCSAAIEPWLAILLEGGGEADFSEIVTMLDEMGEDQEAFRAFVRSRLALGGALDVDPILECRRGKLLGYPTLQHLGSWRVPEDQEHNARLAFLLPEVDTTEWVDQLTSSGMPLRLNEQWQRLGRVLQNADHPALLLEAKRVLTARAARGEAVAKFLLTWSKGMPQPELRHADEARELATELVADSRFTLQDRLATLDDLAGQFPADRPYYQSLRAQLADEYIAWSEQARAEGRTVDWMVGALHFAPRAFPQDPRTGGQFIAARETLLELCDELAVDVEPKSWLALGLSFPRGVPTRAELIVGAEAWKLAVGAPAASARQLRYELDAGWQYALEHKGGPFESTKELRTKIATEVEYVDHREEWRRAVNAARSEALRIQGMINELADRYDSSGIEWESWDADYRQFSNGMSSMGVAARGAQEIADRLRFEGPPAPTRVEREIVELIEVDTPIYVMQYIGDLYRGYFAKANPPAGTWQIDYEFLCSVPWEGTSFRSRDWSELVTEVTQPLVEKQMVAEVGEELLDKIRASIEFQADVLHLPSLRSSCVAHWVETHAGRRDEQEQARDRENLLYFFAKSPGEGALTLPPELGLGKSAMPLVPEFPTGDSDS